MMVRGALATAGFLLGGFLLSALAGNVVHATLAPVSPALALVLASLLAVLACSGSGALWGRMLGRMVGAPRPRHVALACALGFGPVVILVGLALTGLEQLLVVHTGTRLPIHRLYTLLFVPATLIVATVAAYALGWGLGDRKLAAGLAARSALAASAAFLVIDLVMDAAGWRIGAPGAARRATMITVTALAGLGSALSGGAVVGRVLARRPLA